MLDIDSPEERTLQNTHQCFKGRRLLQGILCQQFQERLRLLPQGGCGGGQLLGILLRLLGEQNGPAHQPGSGDNSETSVAIPSRIDSRMPGMDTRCNVS